MRCKCGNIPLSLEVKSPGINRGRWYLKCPTGTCKFFAWDESPYPFIRHNSEIYASIVPRNYTRPFMNFTRFDERDPKSAIKVTKIPIVFSRLSKDLIGIKATANLTVDPVIAGIESIKWSDLYEQYTIPATLQSYNLALSRLPKDIPNLQIEIEPLPPVILDSMINERMLEVQARLQDPNTMTDIEFKWSEFVDSDIYKSLTPTQRDGVSFGLERDGRVLFSDENGIGTIGEALALIHSYKEEWPVLVVCPSILRETWKHEIMNWLGLDDDEIYILDSKAATKDTFKQVGVKRKKVVKTTVRMSYKKRVEKRLNEEGYKSSDSEEDEDEKGGLYKDDDRTNRDGPNVKFYITSHEHAAKRRKEIRLKGFRIVLCTDSHYLKSWTKLESKFLCEMLQRHHRVILTADSIRYLRHVDLFTQARTIAPNLFPDFESFSKRYCDPKNTVFGLQFNGKTNEPELNYLLDSNVWYAPTSKELKPHFPDYVRNTVIFSIKESLALKHQVEDLIQKRDNCDILDEELVTELHERTGEIKKEEIVGYINHVLETYRRPKIAIFYHNDSVYKSIEEHFVSKKIRFTHLQSKDNATAICDEYNPSTKVQFIILNMKMEDLNLSLYSVDLVIFTELPFKQKNLSMMESLFKFKEREGPLSIKYLIAPQTIDDYLRPLVEI